jgi:preprotein translocase subunit SecD
VTRVEQALQAGIQPDFVQFEGNSVRARFPTPTPRSRPRTPSAKALNPDPADPSYIVALNLVSRSPAWLASLRACRCTSAWTCAAACTS